MIQPPNVTVGQAVTEIHASLLVSAELSHDL
jgi:hypothetical protein